MPIKKFLSVLLLNVSYQVGAMTFGKMTLSIMTPGIMSLSITTLCITINNKKCDTQHNFILNVTHAGNTMEQCILKIVNNCFNANIYSFLETSGGQSYNPYLNVVHFFNTSLN
jgi:hypothetical protein